MAITKTPSKTDKSPQEMGNRSYDTDFDLNAVEILVYNPITDAMDRAVQAGQTLPTSNLNPSYVLTRNGDGYITNIAQTIGSDTYNKVITRDGNNYITDISSWSL